VGNRRLSLIRNPTNQRDIYKCDCEALPMGDQEALPKGDCAALPTGARKTQVG